MAFTDSADEHVASALLSRALKTVFDENPGVDRVVLFTDEDGNPNHRAALSCGFLAAVAIGAISSLLTALSQRYG